MTKVKGEKFIQIFIKRLVPAIIIAIILSLVINCIIYGVVVSRYKAINRDAVQSYVTKIQDAYSTGDIDTNPNGDDLRLCIITALLQLPLSDSYAVIVDSNNNVVSDSTRTPMIIYRTEDNDSSFIYSCDMDKFESIGSYYDYLTGYSIPNRGILEYIEYLDDEDSIKIDSAYINEEDFTFLPVEIHIENGETSGPTYTFEYSDSELEGYRLAEPDNIRLFIIMGSPDNTPLKDEIFEELSGAEGTYYHHSPLLIPGSISCGIKEIAYDTDNNPYTIYAYQSTPNTIKGLFLVYLSVGGILILIGALVALIISFINYKRNK